MECECRILSRSGGRTTNEDAGGFWSGETSCCAVLSDGAGGHGGGDIASKVIVRTCLESVRSQPEFGAGTIDSALRAANRAITSEQERQPRFSDMRGTVVVLLIDQSRDVAWWGHYGDTRLYLFRHRRLVTRTKDHSVAQVMVDAGYLPAEKLRESPDRVKLTGALGDRDRYEPIIVDAEQQVFDGDIFLLCTDGLWGLVDEAFMEQTLLHALDPEDWLAALQAEAVARGADAGDNYSAMALWCRDPDQATRVSMPAAPHT